MLNAHVEHPLTTAIAAGSGVRVGGGLVWQGLSRMARSASPHPIDRGVSQ